MYERTNEQIKKEKGRNKKKEKRMNEREKERMKKEQTELMFRTNHFSKNEELCILVE